MPGRLILDCTHTYRTGAGTGIQRVVRRFSDSLLALSREGGPEVVPARIEAGALVTLPVSGDSVLFPSSDSARERIVPPDPRFAAWQRRGHGLNRWLGSRGLQRWLDAGPNEDGLLRLVERPRPAPRAAAQAIRLARDDILLSLDASWVYDLRTVLEEAGRVGATRISMLCDVLPLSHPEFFTEGTRRWFAGWIGALLPRLDGVLTISEATRQELLQVARTSGLRMPPSKAVHLGAEIAGDVGSEQVREKLRRSMGAPSFLTVGTLEPRKNVDFALELFETLRGGGLDIRWHVVGAPGWMAEHTAQRLRAHPEHGTRLFWWTDLDDAELAWCYRHATALVAVSKAEGFGLPLVEARLHGTPVFAADIPVFREVLGNEGRYLPLGSAALAAAAIEDFLDGRLPMPSRDAPSSVAKSWLDRARELREAALEFQRCR